MTTPIVPISAAAVVNPRYSSSTITGSKTATFLPMAGLSEQGFVESVEERPIEEVSKGYTYFEEGDVLLAKITPCMENGKAAIARNLPQRVGFGSTEFHVLRPKEGVDVRYLFYMIWNPFFRHEASRNMTGSAGQKRVPADFVSSFKIPLPLLPEQRRIAAILDKADAIRRKREEGIRLTEELLRSTFLEMFGDPPRSAMKPLAEVAAVVSGVAKGRKLNGRAVNAPYLRVANVQDGFLNLDEIKTIEALPEEVESLALQRGDIVMTEGGDHDKLGRGAIWNADIPNCIHQNHVFRVRVDRATLLPDYFAALLRSNHAKSYFLRCAKKTTNLASINMTQLKALPVPIPSLDSQRSFEKVAHNIIEMSAARKCAVGEAEQLFGSLVQRAFRGEL